jgi:hypothetical protein
VAWNPLRREHLLQWQQLSSTGVTQLRAPTTGQADIGEGENQCVPTMGTELNMTWRVRETENEIAILRGLVDELSIMVETEFANEHHDLSLIEFNEAVQKTIWMANNQPVDNGEPIWWPKHEEIDGDLCLIEETLDGGNSRARHGDTR